MEAPRPSNEADRSRQMRHVGIGPRTLSLSEGSEELLGRQGGGGPRYSLLIKGGRVIDPSQGISEDRDVAISGSKVAKVAANIPELQADQVLDARGKIVTPGL